MSNNSPFIRLLKKLGCINMITQKPVKYWVTDNGLVRTGGDNITVTNGKQISKSEYYRLKRSQKEKQNKIQDEIAKNGCYIDEKDNIYL